MEQSDKLPWKIVREILAALAVVGGLAALRYALGEPVSESDRYVAYAGVILLLYAALRIIVPPLVAKSIKPSVRDEVLREEAQRLETEARAAARKELLELTGITKIFSNFRVCQREVIEGMRESQNIRMFLQLGRTVISGGSDIYDLLEHKTNPSSSIKILHARIDSPYLSKRVARQRDSHYSGWVNEIEHAVKTITALAAKRHGRVEGRQHDEGYVWRLFLMDNMAYVQPYLHDSNNSENAPVLKITKSKNDKILPNSLYHAFSNYFDQKWDENVPETNLLDEIIDENAVCVVAGVLKYHQFFVFAIPRRYIERSSGEVAFHGIGGKLQSSEGYLEALRREALEEIGLKIEVLPASQTRYLTTSAELEPVAIEDSPRPYCLYKRTRTLDPNFQTQDVLWLVGYEAKILINSLDALSPGAEVAAVVVITHETLRKTLDRDLTFTDIQNAGDGSRVIVAGGISLDFKSKAVPSGIAAIVASEHAARVTYLP